MIEFDEIIMWKTCTSGDGLMWFCILESGERIMFMLRTVLDELSRKTASARLLFPLFHGSLPLAFVYVISLSEVFPCRVFFCLVSYSVDKLLLTTDPICQAKLQ